MAGRIRRFSFLRRNPALNRATFSHHYETVHGPLAASLDGFRAFATEYVQNHVVGNAPAAFDGVTATTQVPRQDYDTGFFHHPDYAKVQPDERYLFDITATVSVLGTETVVRDLPPTGYVALILDASPSSGPTLAGRLSRNDLKVQTASALGFGGATLQHNILWEAWFPEAATREAALADLPAGALGLPVRQVRIF